MKARIPRGMGGGPQNLQQIAKQAQKMQEEMDAASTELESKEYKASDGGNAVEVVATGKLELKAVTIKPEVVDPEDIDMLTDLIIAASNEALRQAAEDKAQTMERISGGLNIPGLF